MIRLLQRLSGGDLKLTSCDGDNPPSYAILSHTWAAEEVTYQELVAGAGKDKKGFDKIRFCIERAAADGLQYSWVDTCCIDKSDNTELNTAINSMFRWYQRATKCYVFLSDVSVSEEISDAQAFPIDWLEHFKRSRWFTRGWTLQELVAPASVEFFSKEGKMLGSRISLERDIHQITKIPVGVLRGDTLADCSVDERMSWAAGRTTTVKEDKAYCLLGIFGVFLPLIYGEGEHHANLRLREEIQKRLGGPNLAQMSDDLGSIAAGAVSPQVQRPSCVVPFPRDPDFVDRGTLLGDIHAKCSAPASRVALVGLGGVGKSQLAIEYCYRTAEQSPGTWVFWVHASSAARIEEGYQAIAEQIKLDWRSSPQANVFQVVRNWLRDESNGKWLLVLDNADQSDALSLPASSGDGNRTLPHSFLSYLPQSKQSSVLVTSRTKSTALQLVEQDDIIDIEPMNNASAQALLQKKLGKEADETHVAELAEALEYMPLALVQAAAYIRLRAPRCSVQKYLADFRRSDRKKTSLLDYDGGSLRRDVEAKNAILLTWQISFDHIRLARPSAADLLSLMSFFDRQGIPEELVRSQEWSESEDEVSDVINADEKDSDSDSDSSESEASLEDSFEEDIAMLRGYLLIALTTDGTTFDMHRLVQLATRKWLKENGHLETWKERYITNLDAAFPLGKFENWAQCEPIYPHAKAALLLQPKAEKYLVKWDHLMYNAASYAHDKGNLNDAEEFSIRSMEICPQLFGEESESTLNSKGLLGSILASKGLWKEAEELELQVLETRKRVLGEEHLSTLTSMNNLASTYLNRGRWKEAEELQLQVVEIGQRVLGEEHLDTLTSMGNLAITYWNQGRWKEAEELNLQVVEITKKVLGEEHPETLMSMGNLASTYWNQGRWNKAEELGLQVLEIRKRVLGEEHPDTLTSMNNLATTYSNQGRWKEAEELELQVVEIRKRVLGEEHPSTVTSMNNLAGALYDQRRTAEAIQLMEIVVQVGERVLGPQHPDFLDFSLALEQWRQKETQLSLSDEQSE